MVGALRARVTTTKVAGGLTWPGSPGRPRCVLGAARLHPKAHAPEDDDARRESPAASLSLGDAVQKRRAANHGGRRELKPSSTAPRC
jgi:hypothetical protein